AVATARRAAAPHCRQRRRRRPCRRVAREGVHRRSPSALRVTARRRVEPGCGSRFALRRDRVRPLFLAANRGDFCRTRRRREGRGILRGNHRHFDQPGCRRGAGKFAVARQVRCREAKPVGRARRPRPGSRPGPQRNTGAAAMTEERGAESAEARGTPTVETEPQPIIENPPRAASGGSRRVAVSLAAALALVLAGVVLSPFWAPAIAPLLPWGGQFSAGAEEYAALASRLASVERRPAPP